MFLRNIMNELAAHSRCNHAVGNWNCILGFAPKAPKSNIDKEERQERVDI
jgi:hypothetical protein